MSTDVEMMIAGGAIALGGVVVGAFCAWLGFKVNQAPRSRTSGGTTWGGYK